MRSTKNLFDLPTYCQFGMGGSIGSPGFGVWSELAANIVAVPKFMNTHGLLHFDAHFANILTDGARLYFADFGLAISSRFELSQSELEFFRLHRNYEYYYLAMNLAHRALPSALTTKECNNILREYVADNRSLGLSPIVMSVLE